MGELDRTKQLGNQDAVPGLGHHVAPVIAWALAARDGLALGLELCQPLVQALHLVDRRDHVAQAFRDLVLRQLVVVKDHDFLDGPFRLPQLGSKLEHLLDDDGRA